MTGTAAQIRPLDAAGLDRHLQDLCRILVDCVHDGAAISFVLPFTHNDATRFWIDDVRPEVAAKRRLMFVAEWHGSIVGTVQLITTMPPNQHHRCEIAKMMVQPAARRQGIARTLVHAALAAGKEAGKTLVTLDTRTGDVAEPLYRAAGFSTAGVIPDFGWNPDGQSTHATTYMYRYL